MTLFSQTHSFIHSTNHFWGGMLWHFARCWGYKTQLKHGFALRVFEIQLTGYKHATVLTKQREAEEYRRRYEQTMENVTVWMNIKRCIRLRHRAGWGEGWGHVSKCQVHHTEGLVSSEDGNDICVTGAPYSVWGQHWYTHLEWGVKCWQKQLGMRLGVLG